MKTITIRLYRQHDMDLLSLYMHEGFDFTKEMKNAVTAIVKNQDYMIKVPEYKPERVYLKRMHHVHLYFSDEEVLKKLENIRQGQVNSFFKAAMRACLDSFPYGAYFGGDGVAISRAEETKYVNAERQARYEEREKESPKKPKPAPKPVERRKPVRVRTEEALPEPEPFENIPIPEPEGSYEPPISDDEGMDLFNAINAVSGGHI